ncbi:MAG: winged helix-turn-helix transcriptional regulator [Candidatus Hydrothermarchaeota archaeon]|nr:winged helix-turn-helix transcriptional regulator [Candidatus Hydrothermarchaeota archaeon]
MPEVDEIVKFLLSNERERKVLESLYQGRKSFTELKENLGLKHNAELTRVLKNLRRFILFDHVYERNAEDKIFSYYQINSTGRTIYEMIEDVERYIAIKTKTLSFELEPTRISYNMEVVYA